MDAKMRQSCLAAWGSIQNTNQLQYTNDMYRLNYDTLQWSLDPVDEGPPYAFGAAGCILYDSVLIVFGGASLSRAIDWRRVLFIQKDTWGYYSNEKVWIKYESATKPRKRAVATAVCVQGRQMVMFGGGYIAHNRSVGKWEEGMRRLCELWSFSIPPTTANLSIARYGSEWHMLKASGPKNCLYNSISSVGRKLFVYGGNGESNDFADVTTLLHRQKDGDILRFGARCVDYLWEYDLESNTWKQLNYTGPGPGKRCAHNAVVYADHLIVFGGCNGYVQISLNTNTLIWGFRCPIEESSTGLWSYSRVLGTWLRHSREPATYKIGVFPLTVVWKQWILSYGGVNPNAITLGEIASDQAGFSFFKPACPPGTEASNDCTVTFCTPCSVGYYADYSNGIVVKAVPMD